MPGMSDIIKDSVVEFSRLQNWMSSAKEKVLVRKWVGTPNCPFTNRINIGCPDCKL